MGPYLPLCPWGLQLAHFHTPCSHMIRVRPGFWLLYLPDSQGKSGLLLALESLFWKPPTFWRDFYRSTRKSRTFPRQLLPSVIMQVSQLQPGLSSYSRQWCPQILILWLCGWTDKWVYGLLKLGGGGWESHQPYWINRAERHHVEKKGLELGSTCSNKMNKLELTW